MVAGPLVCTRELADVAVVRRTSPTITDAAEMRMSGYGMRTLGVQTRDAEPAERALNRAITTADKRASRNRGDGLSRGDAVLYIEHADGGNITEFFEHGRQHHRAETRGVRGDHKKYELECQGHAHEAIKNWG